MARPDIAREIVRLVGDAGSMREAGTGWPSRVDILTQQGPQRVALHVSRASPHARKAWEWRFQNPGNREAVASPGGALPLLVGLDEIDGRPVLIVVDGRSRVARLARFSILFNKRISREAARSGWSEQETTSGEKIYAMWPRLLPLVVELINEGVDLPIKPIISAAEAAGLLENDGDEAAERTRRTVSAYVRDAKFSRVVRDVYEHRCAMCRVGIGLVAGAHIMPVSAPGAPDQVWNGLALCHNHHSAFDAHHIWIAADYTVRISPNLAEAAQAQPESARFLEQTRPALWLPQRAQSRPRLAMLEERYTYYEEEYEWAPAL